MKVERMKMNSPEYKEHQRKITQGIWDNMTPEERKQRGQLIKDSWTEERRQARRDMMKKRLEDPIASKIYRDNLSKAVRASNLRPEVIEKRKEAAQIAVSDPEYRKTIKERMNQPWNVELNKRYRGPLGMVSKNLKNGKISEEEAEKLKKDLYNIRDEILEKYKEEREQYKKDHPTKRERNRRK